MPEGPRVPPLDAAHLGVEVSFQRVVDVDDLLEVSPAQFSPQCGDNLLIREYLGESEHVPQAFLGEAAAALRGQLSPQRGTICLAVFGPLLVEDILAYPLANVPVQADQPGVDRPCDLLAGRFDQGSDVAQEPIGSDRRHR